MKNTFAAFRIPGLKPVLDLLTKGRDKAEAELEWSRGWEERGVGDPDACKAIVEHNAGVVRYWRDMIGEIVLLAEQKANDRERAEIAEAEVLRLRAAIITGETEGVVEESRRLYQERGMWRMGLL